MCGFIEWGLEPADVERAARKRSPRGRIEKFHTQQAAERCIIARFSSCLCLGGSQDELRDQISGLTQGGRIITTPYCHRQRKASCSYEPVAKRRSIAPYPRRRILCETLRPQTALPESQRGPPKSSNARSSCLLGKIVNISS